MVISCLPVVTVPASRSGALAGGFCHGFSLLASCRGEVVLLSPDGFSSQFRMIALRSAFVALLLGLAVAPALAQDRLPPPSASIPELRRGKDGRIEVIKPEGAERGCTAGVLCVGPGGYPTVASALAAARDGATVEVTGGVYKEAITIAAAKVTLRGVGGRPHFDCAAAKLAADQACILLAGEGATVENVEVSGAVLGKGAGENGACLRNAAGASFTLRRVICHGSQQGLLAEGGTILVENSEFYDNAWTAETHNAYFGGGCASVTVRGSIFRDARVGAELTLRCRKILVDSTTVRAARGGAAIDLPEGGDAMIVGGLLWQGTAVRNVDLVAFARDGCSSKMPLQIVRVHIEAVHDRSRIVNYGRCAGQPVVVRDLVVDAGDPQFFGYVLVNGVERKNAAPPEDPFPLRQPPLPETPAPVGETASAPKPY
jgi:hypothetical protein